jgi:hypothetical protein
MLHYRLPRSEWQYYYCYNKLYTVAVALITAQCSCNGAHIDVPDVANMRFRVCVPVCGITVMQHVQGCGITFMVQRIRLVVPLQTQHCLMIAAKVAAITVQLLLLKLFEVPQHFDTDYLSLLPLLSVLY